MPRGMRAHYEVAGDGLEGDNRTHSGFLHEKLLPARCWCDTTFVLIHRSDLLDGNTGSCGPHCKPPDDSAPALSLSLPRTWSGGGCMVRTPEDVEQRYAGWSAIDDDLIADARRGCNVPRPFSYPPEVRVRRDFVATLYAQQKHPLDIALSLNVPVIVVRDDLVELRKQRRVA